MLLNDQKQLLAAVGRVLSRNASTWNANRSGHVLTDLQAAKRAFAKLRGRSTETSRPNSERKRSFWGWGYEGEGPDPLMIEVLLEVIKA